MTRIVTQILILFVLFTHSVMAMDVHISHEVSSDINESAEHDAHTSTPDHSHNRLNSPSQTPCADAGGHCSHHQAHTSGLVCVNTLSYTDSKPVLFSQLKHSAFLHTQTPPRRPPKA